MDYLQKIQKLEEETPKTNAEWLTAWRELGQVTYGILPDDPRLERIMRWLNAADAAFAIDSWPLFQEAAEEVKLIAREKP